MKQISDDDINRLLSRMKSNVPDSKDSGDFEEILKKAQTPDAVSGVRFTQLRNAGIIMLLVIAVNVIIMSSAGNSNTGDDSQEASTSFLQPYNLNVY